MLCNTNNSIWYKSFVGTLLNGFKYCYFTQIILFSINGFKYSKWLDDSIWPINEILIGTTGGGQSGPGSNVNEVVLHIFQSSRTGASPSDGLLSKQG